jgi:cardiolipin synthase
VAKYVSFSFYEKFLKMGGNMYLFHEYTHGKGVIVDDTWCTFGSANMDNLALLHNYELNVGSENKEFILSLTRDFDSRVSKCRKLTLSDWRKGNIFTKILEKVAGLLKWIA